MAGAQATLVLLETVILTRMLSLCLGSTLVNQNGEIPLVGRLYFNRYLPESELTRVYGRSFDQCRGECDARQSCKSVNYNRLAQSCVLNDADLDGSSPITADQDIASDSGVWPTAFDRKRRSTAVLQEEANFVFSQKSHWQQDGQRSGCPDECDVRAKCTESGNDVTCNFTECVPILVSELAEPQENGVIMGNRNVEGSKLRLVCDQGYTVTGNDVTQCQTGQWSPIGACTSRCPKGWQYYGNHCYRYREERVTDTEAQELCAKDDSYLVIIEDKSENDFIENRVIVDASASDWIWLGGHRLDNLEFAWDDGSDITFFDWYVGQPNNNNAEDCLVTIQTNGQFYWHDAYCDEHFTLVCELELE